MLSTSRFCSKAPALTKRSGSSTRKCPDELDVPTLLAFSSCRMTAEAAFKFLLSSLFPGVWAPLCKHTSPIVGTDKVEETLVYMRCFSLFSLSIDAKESSAIMDKSYAMPYRALVGANFM